MSIHETDETVAQTVCLLYRGLAACAIEHPPTASRRHSATQQIINLRYVSTSPTPGAADQLSNSDLPARNGRGGRLPPNTARLAVPPIPLIPTAWFRI